MREKWEQGDITYPAWGIVHRKSTLWVDAEKFILHEKSLLPPLTALPGMGQKAAQAIVEARQYGQFISIEDLATRSHIPTPAVELLREHGCLDGMMESNQVELFA